MGIEEKIWKEGWKEGYEIGLQEANAEIKPKLARRCLLVGIPVDVVAEACELPLEKVLAMKADLKIP